MSEVYALPLIVPRNEVLRCLGYPNGKSPSSRVLDRLDELWASAQERLIPRGAYVLVAQQQARAAGMPEPTEEVAFAVCTIGPGLEALQESLGSQGDWLSALIVDAFGSAAAEAAADQLQARICASLRDRGLASTRRVSPGYGSWSLSYQSQLLAYLPTQELSITLTDGLLMVPRKSVSFAALIDDSSLSHPRARCESCERVDCAFRVRPANGSKLKNSETSIL